MLRIIARVFAWIAAVVLVIGLATLTTVDRSPIQEQEGYRNTLERLASSTWEPTSSGFWLAGWSAVNVTPPQPVPLVGYSPRGNYEFVQDSSFVKALSLSNGQSNIAWLNYELLIVHPQLAQKVREGIQNAGIQLDQVIFTATHTHSGMGGYTPGPLGALAFGGYEEEVVQQLVDGSVRAIQAALASQDTVSLTFKKTAAPAFVANRFIKDGAIDPYVRQLIFTKKGGKKAIFFTYSAHATALSSKFMGLSGDYPSYLTEHMEQRGYDFALYAAGTVGSHKPLTEGNRPENVQEYATKLDATLAADSTTPATSETALLRHGRLDIDLGSPQLRISKDLRLRPWLFHYLLGEVPAYLDITQIGSLVFISSSGELSGVFYAAWDKLAQEKGLQLVVTVFNGSYIGYITPDELYDASYHEVREMNWFGPGNGHYFDRLIQGVIQKVDK
jgi:hypothetical protein